MESQIANLRSEPLEEQSKLTNKETVDLVENTAFLYCNQLICEFSNIANESKHNLYELFMPQELRKYHIDR